PRMARQKRVGFSVVPDGHRLGKGPANIKKWSLLRFHIRVKSGSFGAGVFGLAAAGAEREDQSGETECGKAQPPLRMSFVKAHNRSRCLKHASCRSYKL